MIELIDRFGRRVCRVPVISWGLHGTSFGSYRLDIERESESGTKSASLEVADRLSDITFPDVFPCVYKPWTWRWRDAIKTLTEEGFSETPKAD